MGRPITWTEEKREEAFSRILETLATSELGLDHICNGSPDLPSPSKFYEWLREFPVLEQRYARARELQAIYITDTVGVIATQLVSKTPSHTIEPQAFKAYLDAAKWRTEKLAPITHGAKVDVTTKGDKLPAASVPEVTPDVLAEAMKQFKESV